MKYCSTRNNDYLFSLSDAIITGLAPDGGLFVPVSYPEFQIKEFEDSITIQEMAKLFLQPFFEGDDLENELSSIVENTFSFPIPLTQISEENYQLDLIHGPTGAFKDVGARFLAQCFSYFDQHFTILVATSGDTGSAVGSAFYGLNNITVAILYPNGKISEFQERQLTYWNDNVHAFSVNSDFDQCQQLAKSAFQDNEIRDNFNLTSANSINIGRLLPQCIYYVYASISYFKQRGKKTNLIIPTGNMGNALAAIWVKHMGFPIDEIYLACNANKVIPFYFEQGIFEPKPSIKTLANAMDVGNPSNMERFLQLVEENTNLIHDLHSASVTDNEIIDTIDWVHQKWNLSICPHTATAYQLFRNHKIQNAIVIATAHPYKFRDILLKAGISDIDPPDNLKKFLDGNHEKIDLEPSLPNLEKELLRIHSQRKKE